ncbi:MAG: adenylate/guanylate cyclase domain-containing protein [Gaiellaceae bacterium]
MISCPNCGQENPEGFRLCGMCGASLAPETVAREERKVVTVLFCDLVGFTAKAEQLDPEDVRAILGPYHTRVRSELERHGGTVEKFIGDAVMAVFGAPVAHEDDPERAVRAALAIRDFAVDEGLELRVGITTGEALVSLDASPSEGEGMASGDVVNTAARLQSAAPVNGVLVDETTYRATRHVIDFGEAKAFQAKGKSHPVTVWQALLVRARLGMDLAHEARSDLVGREEEVGVLRDALTRVRRARMSQLVTLVGVPGIGKSRLLYELRQIIETGSELITWRQGRCLAYGDGVTLWALGEIVKAEAGIHEQDPPDVAGAKIHRAVEGIVTNPADVGWIESHLLALVGLAEESELGGDRRGEAFSAWRHFFEAMAEQRPLVLVFEDLHWADESLLDFVDELVDWVTDVPLLVVGTARPELLERRPGWGGGKLNATTLALQPLSDEQTALLLGKLLERPVLAAESQQALLERAGGNPLYAEQFAELYLERGSADELPLPETLQGIIAARLDGLPQPEKELLRDAAVVGKVFWMGALRRNDREAGTILHSLERKGFVRRQRRSAVEGENELAFAHALVRDVAYGQIARPDRVEKHRRSAEWIEGLGRPEDHAELLAHHWRSALDLARALGGDEAVLVDRTRLALRNAGDRAFALNSYAVAAAQYEEALGLWPGDDEERPNLLFRLGRALYDAYDDRREQALDEARDALLAAGESELAAETEAFLALVSWYQGHGEAARAHLSRAQELTGDSVSASGARVLAVSARNRAIAGEYEDGRTIAETALEMAEALGLDELRAHALTTIGMAKNFLGDPSGLQDMERALELALEIDSPVASSIVNNLAVEAFLAGDLTRAEALYADALRIAERLGDAEGVRFIGANLIWVAFMRGRWDEASAGAEDFVAECEAGSPHTNELGMRLVRGSIRRARGDADGALADHLHAVALARERAAPLDLVAALLTCAARHAERGELAEARALVDEAIPIVRETGVARGVVELVPFAESLDVRDALREAMEANPPRRDIPWRNAALLALRDDLRDAADIFSAAGNPTFEAELRLYGGERLIEAGRRREGEAELEKALAFYRSVGATFFIQRGEQLLAKSA